jgi:sulfinoalanine decarboxylase
MHGLPRLVVYTSVDAHYSIKKLCAFEGIGSDNLYLINTDAKGKMDVGHLRQQIQRTLEEKAVPIMVSATAGKVRRVLLYSLIVVPVNEILKLLYYYI